MRKENLYRKSEKVMNNGQNASKCPNSGWRFYKRP